MDAPKLLVVDDQPINVQLLKRKLEREGIHVLEAYSGIEAIDVTLREKPDLIILDVMMPDMDGIEVCQRLQANEDTRTIPVIFITARTSKEGKLEGLGAGAVDYITKPIDLDETLARVQTHLRFVSINRELADLQSRLAESRRIATIGAIDVFRKDLEDGSAAFGFFNRGDRVHRITAKLDRLGSPGLQRVRDLWRQRDLGDFTGDLSVEVAPHDVQLYRVAPLA